MTYRVIRKFKDKYTGEIYSPGKTLELNDGERAKDLVARGLVEGPVKTDLDDITKKEIMEKLDAEGTEYNARATKQELYELLR